MFSLWQKLLAEVSIRKRIREYMQQLSAAAHRRRQTGASSASFSTFAGLQLPCAPQSGLSAKGFTYSSHHTTPQTVGRIVAKLVKDICSLLKCYAHMSKLPPSSCTTCIIVLATMPVCAQRYYFPCINSDHSGRWV